MVETTTETEPLVITPVQYALIYRQPQAELPSVEALIEARIARLTGLDLAKEVDLRQLAGNIQDRNFAFVPAWPDPLDFGRWMNFVLWRGKQGVNYLTPSAVTDDIEVPTGPYVMLSVDDGWNRRNIAPDANRAAIVSEGRSPFIARDGVSYAGDHPNSIDGHGIDCVGSRYGAYYVPCVCLNDKKPALLSHWFGDPHPDFGAGSCGSRQGLRV